MNKTAQQNGTHIRLGEDNYGVIHTQYKTKDGKKIEKIFSNGHWYTKK